ncbi:M20 family metallo-hydrolase [Terribacillus saccharophilus]|uniref:M20 family metallo-hydrolase n=1 Tax=Terribacillus saccharophilus TaxID=361277 RepID=UPI0039823380
MNIIRLEKTLHDINRYGQSNEGITRLAYTKDDREAADYFYKLCEEAGMKVRVDACGNVIARREGNNPDLPVVACGSHLDTVMHGGQYDGTLGVIAGLEVVRSLNDQEIETDHPIEVIAFACEESARFGISTFGSKAMAGLLEKDSVAALRDGNGQTIHDAFSECNLDFDTFEDSSRQMEQFKVFLELHIEQGPVLEREGIQIGLVTGIAAPTRFEVTIQGQASHSGTTPMHYRKDAFLGAAEIALEIEKAAKSENVNGTVATVGVCEVKPGAMNVVPDFVEMKIDIRGISVQSKNRVIASLHDAMKQIREKRSLEIASKIIGDESPIELDSEVVQSLAKCCDDQGLSHMQMPSGAGHDSMNMARLCPTGMIFVPSKDGLSHHCNEYTAIEQIGAGASLLEAEIIKWACSSKIKSKM